jgi:ZIP family zinc transporter
MRNALVAAALTGLATGLGAFPFFFVRALPRRVYDGILGLGAG